MHCSEVSLRAASFLCVADGQSVDVVPTSGHQACTAAPMRIQYHNSSAIVAHVEFLTQQEWLDELRLLFSSLVDENGRMKSNEDMGKDGAAALQKVRSLG